MGAEPPCKPRPCSQEAACSRLMAVTQRRRPPRLADLPHDQRQRTGGEAPSSTAPHGDRIAEARANTGLTHPMHQAHRRGRAPGRPPPPAQVPPAGRPSASKEAGHGKANGPALTRVSAITNPVVICVYYLLYKGQAPAASRPVRTLAS